MTMFKNTYIYWSACDPINQVLPIHERRSDASCKRIHIGKLIPLVLEQF